VEREFSREVGVKRVLKLIDPAGDVVDTANGEGGAWPAGSASPTYASMERIDPSGEDIPSNWADNNGKKVCGKGSKGSLIRGTPGKENSVSWLPSLPC